MSDLGAEDNTQLYDVIPLSLPRKIREREDCTVRFSGSKRASGVVGDICAKQTSQSAWKIANQV